jgi:lipid II:glycine glycyltransferase (peptidoglycan interpeptide bridge formation enzyme)
LKSKASDIEFFACYAPEQAAAWDDFVATRCPHAHVEQMSGWSRLKQAYGAESAWVWVRRGSQVLGGAVVQTRRIGGLARIGYVERGPVWDPAEFDSCELAIEAVYRFARSHHLAYLVVAPPYDCHELIPLLESRDFWVKPERLPPTGVGRATLLVDLRQDLDTILSRMSMTKRQNIRRGLRKGVRVRCGDASDAETVRRLMWQACERRGIRPAPPQEDYFETMWRVLGTTGRLRFFIAEVNGEPVSVACALMCSGAMRVWRVGWSEKNDRFDANDVLHWEMMKCAKELGCREFDFLHIRPDHAHAILRGDEINDSYSGVTRYKIAFGGRLHILPELYYRSFHPAIQMALSLGATQIIHSRLGTRLLNNIVKALRNSARVDSEK